ncbi:MAG: hypothetical protein HW405_407 [Candidatus Berkelbacteria bacterium]|nr:hypothetical protein [Candidatus Berkelbacteria bacterium]
MDYFGLLKKSFQITLKHRYLWIFGIFIVGIKGLNYFTYLFPGNNNSTSTSSDVWTNYWVWLLIIVAIVLFISLIWWVLSIIANGAILGSVKSIQKNESNDFHTGFNFGVEKFWKVLLTTLILVGIIFFAIIITSLPIILFSIANVLPLAVIFGLIMGLLDVVLIIYLMILFPYALRLAVLDDFSPWNAYKASFNLFKKNWSEILIVYLILWAISMGIGIGYLFIILIVGGLLFGIGYAIYLASSLGTIIYASIASVLFLVMMTFLSSVVSTFYSSMITLTYLEIIKKGKPELV